MNAKSSLWEIKNPSDPKKVKRLAKSLGISEITAGLLLNRRLEEPEEADVFLNPSLDRLRNPFGLKDMEKAVERIKRAMEAGEIICVYGDYDVDGVTSTAIMMTYFRRVGYERAIWHIPERKSEGYGLNKEAIGKIAEMGCRLIITVDCGVASLEETECINRLEMDVIITDHHTPEAELPRAYAVVNPKRSDCEFGFRELSGAGIAFKLVQALLAGSTDLDAFIELSAVGTVADIVPLLDDNRIIVKKGLEILNRTAHPGLKALKEVSGLEGKPLNAGHIAFMLAPRINAAGRLGHANTALELLTTEDVEQAKRLAERLNEMNMERQTVEAKIFEEAEALIEKSGLDGQKILVLSSAGWDSGIIGIVASKLCEKHHRPVVMIAVEESVGKASARSFGDIDLYALLKGCESYYIKFGGHRMAAGFSIPAESIGAFAIRLQNLASESIGDHELIGKLGIDCRMDTQAIDFKLVEDIDLLEPFGCANARPKFLLRDMSLNQFRYVGKDQKHLKATFTESNRMFDAIGFNMGDYSRLIKKNQQVDIVFCLEKNVFRNVASIQFNMKDMRIHERGYYAQSDWGLRYMDALLDLYGETALPRVLSPKGEAFPEKISIPQSMQEDGTLIAVYTLEGLYRLMGQLEDSTGGDFNPYRDFYFGREKPGPGVTHVAVLPNPGSLKERGCRRIVNYDGYGIGHEDHDVDLSVPADGTNLEAMILETMPDRSHLVKVYKALKDKGFSGRDALASMVEVPIAKLHAALWILKDCMLIGNTDENFHIVKVPDEKVDIFENRLYRNLTEFLQNNKANQGGAYDV